MFSGAVSDTQLKVHNADGQLAAAAVACCSMAGGLLPVTHSICSYLCGGGCSVSSWQLHTMVMMQLWCAAAPAFGQQHGSPAELGCSWCSLKKFTAPRQPVTTTHHHPCQHHVNMQSIQPAHKCLLSTSAQSYLRFDSHSGMPAGPEAAWPQGCTNVW